MGNGCGKAILLGEHAVVHGTPALAAGIDRGVEASATLAPRASLHVQPWDVTVHPGSDEDLGRALAAVLDDGEPLAVHADVALPAGAGLGCSAALGVAVIRAIDEARGRTREPAEIAEAALAWERVFHGNPSGVDNTMAAHGGVAVYRRGHPLEPIRLRRPFTLVVGDSGEHSSTKEMVAGVARQRDRDPARFDKTLEAITTLVSNARLALEDGDLRAVGQLMDLNQNLLGGWMLSTTALEEMIGAARGAGAHGAKLTGAGGGGCMIALCDDDRAEPVRDAIAATGRRAFVTLVGADRS